MLEKVKPAVAAISMILLIVKFSALEKKVQLVLAWSVSAAWFNTHRPGLSYLQGQTSI